MNRIILIGNGFDKAHKLDTGYEDFINHFWSEFAVKIFSEGKQYLESYEYRQDDNVYAYFKINRQGECDSKISLSELRDHASEIKTLSELQATIADYNAKRRELCRKTKSDPHGHCSGGSVSFELNICNSFLKRISEKAIENWVDIEREYYDALVELLSENDSKKRNEKVKILNDEFNAVKRLLVEYLIQVNDKKKPEILESVNDAFRSPIKHNEIVHSAQDAFMEYVKQRAIDYGVFMRNRSKLSFAEIEQEQLNEIALNEIIENGVPPQRTLILNFNYTNTAKELYIDGKLNFEVINIHGELNNAQNPIVFGYGDEMDSDYARLENESNSCFTDNFKQYHYNFTNNYSELINFIQDGHYQVCIMGHSCGSSDRALLNTLLEHDNCVSVRLFYRQYEDGSDDYNVLFKNTCRNFKDKTRARNTVVNRMICTPLVPVSKG